MNNKLDIQVDKSAYIFDRYVNKGRWQSYYCQIDEALRGNPSSILYIGCGDRIVIDFIKSVKPDIHVDTFDFDKALLPDIHGDIRDIDKLVTAKYDCVVCCQVLEHLPIECFRETLMKIRSCLNSGGTCILSLPDAGRKVGFKLDIPGVHIRFEVKIPKVFRKSFDYVKDGLKEHYWEINATWNLKRSCIRKVINEIFSVKKEYLVELFDYHRFFICINL